MQPPTRDTDELKGLALLVLAGAAGLVALIALTAMGGAPVRGARTDETERTTQVAELPRWSGEGPSRSDEPRAAHPPLHGSGAYAMGIEHEDDPQMRAFERSYASPVDAGVAQPFSIAYHRGTLVSASGLGVRPGATCEVRVLPVSSFEFNCLLRVTCDDVVLYPDDALRAGYAPCEIEGHQAVTAADRSSHDGDREIDLDVRSRSVIVEEHTPEGDSLISARVVLES